MIGRIVLRKFLSSSLFLVNENVLGGRAEAQTETWKQQTDFMEMNNRWGFIVAAKSRYQTSSSFPSHVTFVSCDKRRILMNIMSVCLSVFVLLLSCKGRSLHRW